MVKMYLVGVVLWFLDSQIDGFSWDEPVGEDFLNGWKGHSLAVIPVSHGHWENVYEETFVHDVPSLGGECDEVIEVMSSYKNRQKISTLLKTRENYYLFIHIVDSHAYAWSF